MQGWRQRYGPAAALILTAWFAFQQIKDIILFRSDLAEMADAMAGWGSFQVPAPLMKWVLEFVVVFVIAILAAPALDRAWRALKAWYVRRHSRLSVVRRLFAYSGADQKNWISEFLSGPMWTNVRPAGTLAEASLQAIDKQEIGRNTEFLYRIHPDLRLALYWRLRLWNARRQRHHRQVLRDHIRNLNREERTLLWLFWRERPSNLGLVIRSLSRARHALEASGVIEVENDYYGAKGPVTVRLTEEAKPLVEKYVLGGKEVKHNELQF